MAIKNILRKEGVWGRRGAGLGLIGGLAVDGKRNEVQRNGDGRFVDVASRREGLKGRESEGGRVKSCSRLRGWRIFFYLFF